MIRPPCLSCPWRVEATADDIPNFKLELAERLAGCQSGTVGAPIFGCHLSKLGEEFPCAGWLAVHGYHSIAIRLRVMKNLTDPEALKPQPGWPELHTSYDEMMEKLRGLQR